eukprot:2101000-Amphidinium_carterae.1
MTPAGTPGGRLGHCSAGPAWPSHENSRAGVVPYVWGLDGTACEGELYAVIQAAEAFLGFFFLYTDNQAVWHGCQCNYSAMASDSS